MPSPSLLGGSQECFTCVALWFADQRVAEVVGLIGFLRHGSAHEMPDYLVLLATRASPRKRVAVRQRVSGALCDGSHFAPVQFGSRKCWKGAREKEQTEGEISQENVFSVVQTVLHITRVPFTSPDELVLKRRRQGIGTGGECTGSVNFLGRGSGRGKDNETK